MDWKRIGKVAAMVGIATLLVGISGVAYAYETCPSVCYQSCDTYYCEFQQWLAGCARRICE